MAKENPRRDVSLWNPFGEEFFPPERFFREWTSPGHLNAQLLPSERSRPRLLEGAGK